ncbi:MAG: hypothetical protein BV459_06530 [Thermoplasmata archaeon M11B2D]|nr:MAG: hypothetical protein BV459_06530 [Thermoplasmata archaeon M11B2D]
MKKIVICGVFILFLLLSPRLACGGNVYLEPEEKPITNQWTILIGIITKPKLVNGDLYVTFRALFVHYKTHWYGNTRTGFLHGIDEVILLPRFHYGILANHFVCAKFNLALFPGVS